MFRKTTKPGSIGMAATAFTCGFMPLAVQAFAGSQGNIAMVATTEASCASPSSPEPVTVAVEARPDTFKNKPYSGIGTTEVITTLADGNRITRTNTMKYYRDSAGRTRTEYSLAAIGPFTPDQAQTVVTIADPVEGTRYVLNSALKRADVFKVKKLEPARARATTKPDRNLTWVTKAPDGPTTVPPITTPTFTGSAAAGGTPSRLPPVMIDSGPVAPPANAGFFMQYAPPTANAEGCKPNVKPLPAPTSLGERTIEGLKVAGSRMEFTIAAGAVGNELPIVVHSEQWFSPDLGVVVSSSHHDPMMGDTNYRLEQISRTEPEASLFTVPADYTKVDAGAGGPGVFFEGPLPGAPPGAGIGIRGEGVPGKPAAPTEK